MRIALATVGTTGDVRPYAGAEDGVAASIALIERAVG